MGNQSLSHGFRTNTAKRSNSLTQVGTPCQCCCGSTKTSTGSPPRRVCAQARLFFARAEVCMDTPNASEYIIIN